MVKQSGLIAVRCALGLCANACAALAQPPKFATQIVPGSAGSGANIEVCTLRRLRGSSLCSKDCIPDRRRGLVFET
jgi:hypothetical protein